MSNQPITMLQIRRILQLLKAGHSKRKIARELHIGRNTISGYVSRLEASGQDIDSLMKLPDSDLGALLYRNTDVVSPDSRFEYIEERLSYYEKQLAQKGVTRLLLWKEYKEEVPGGYEYTQFCEHLYTHQVKNGATMHFEHKPGERVQVDFAGSELSYVDKSTGEVISCPVLVCVLPYSGYTYVEALVSAKQEYFFAALCHCMDYFRGVPGNVLSDNMKQYVKKSNRYEPVFSEASEQWALHYQTTLSATRVRKPKDKPTVENMVNIAYMRIYAPLRNKTFYSLEELNIAIMVQLDTHHSTPFQKRTYSRLDRFVEDEQHLLKELPAEPFIFKHTVKAKVQKNYHIILGEDWHQYSVPYQYISKTVKLVYDIGEVEIYLGTRRIAAHKRNLRKHGYTTLSEHMPEKHKKYHETKGWNSEYFLKKANEIGENSFEIMGRILESRTFTEQAYRACQGLLRLSEQYGRERFENACKRAIPAARVSYRMISNILKNNLDKQQSNQMDLFSIIPEHGNIRGPGSYN